MKSICYAAALAASSFHSLAQTEIDARAIAFNCRICHAESLLDSEQSIPSLKNLSAQQIRQALLNFKYDHQSATLMPRLAKGYSDEELAAVAEYLRRQ